MLDNIEKLRKIAKLSFKSKEGVDTENKTSLFNIIDGENTEIDAFYHSDAAALLYGLLEEEDVPEVKKRIDSCSYDVANELFIVLAGTLKEEGQDYYLEKLHDESFTMKYVVLHAIHKFGDERFMKPCLDYLHLQMNSRPTMEEVRAFIQGRSTKKIKDQQEYLRNLSDILAIIEYLKRVDNTEYHQALEFLLNNADRLEARERRYLRDEHGLEFDDYQ